MKKLIIILILSGIIGTSMAQDDVYFKPENKSRFSSEIKQLKTEEKDQYQVDFVRHCLKKYHDEKMMGYGLQLTGVLLAGAGLALNNNEENTGSPYPGNNTTNVVSKALIYGGAACSLAGIITLIDSEKWMKMAYIGPDGFGVRFRF